SGDGCARRSLTCETERRILHVYASVVARRVGGGSSEPASEVIMFERMKRRIGDRVERQVVAAGIESVKYVRPVRLQEASGLVAAVYEQLARDFQLLAPITLTSPVPPLLAACWTVLRETLVAGTVPRLEKELVAEAGSKGNAVPECGSAPALMLRGGAEHDVARYGARGDTESIVDPRLRALAVWALNSRSPDHPALAAPPFDPGAAPEIVGTAVAFHMINRVVDVFLGSSPFAMPPGLQWTAARRVGTWLGGARAASGRAQGGKPRDGTRTSDARST